MRRTARTLSVAVLAGAALSFAAPTAFAEPAAEVRPSGVTPGGGVTVSVSCDPVGGHAHDTGSKDAGAHDTGSKDAGSHDTGAHDTGSKDAGAHDTESHDTGSHGDSCATSRPCTEAHGKSCDTSHPCTESHGDSCDGGVIPRGVRAGEGGSFTDSVPALVTGGLLIAGASGAAVYRLRRKKPAKES
ncbi:hypothetical protein CLM62_00720 [Streptomyces sp. SA15]|uniref:hypothetical protein n=1 Tax=Streptomyces sp. SA15 TaxID=934019 RepID=UPI000BAEA0A0|nr:hypothetical protein [Streptomyces sp. SA15]PAZ17726.1 hypothetical protein CLM62_00720 [Streptomyces sp. SA15]